MQQHALVVLSLVETAFLGLLILILPRIGRRGLLFGVYVGEETSVGEPAREMVRHWNRRIALMLATALGLAGLAGRVLPPPLAYPLGPILLLAGSLGAYVAAYRCARELAAPGIPESVAVLGIEDSGLPILALIPLFVALLAGTCVLVYSGVSYRSLPEQIPVHFGLDGLPDRWAARSGWTVLGPPLLSLAVTLGLGGVTCLIASAKRAIRSHDGGESGEAQRRFPRAVIRMLSGLTLLVTALMTAVSLSQMRVMLGEATRIPAWVMLAVGGLLLYCFGGII